MKIRINTIMAHPRLGAVEPGTILDLTEADAQPLLDALVADRIEPAGKKSEGAPHETAQMESEHETGMQAAHMRGRAPSSGR